MRSIIFNKAGKIAFTKYSNGTLSFVPANMSVRNGVVQSISSSISYNTTTLPDGNSDWPAGEYDIGAEGNITVNMSSYQPELLAFLLGTTTDALTNKTMMAVDEEAVVPAVSPFSYKAGHVTNSDITPIVTDDSASPFVKVSATPAVGQFAVSADNQTFLFNSADAGKNVYLTYDYSAATANSIGLPKVVSRPALNVIISGEAVSEDESTVYDSNIVIDKCKAVGDINPPEQSREPKGWSFTLKVLKPRGTNKAVDYVFAPRA